MSDRTDIAVEIAFGTRDRQELLELTVPAGTTVTDALSRSHIAELFPGEQIDRLAVGIWGRPVAGTTRLKEGDRIEIYRPLVMDPREARRRLAAMGRFMGGGPTPKPPS
ncbi:MAG: RnfH family protein [Woeseiaceae bacterium]